MKFIYLTYSSNLITTPDFVGVPNLEKLVFEHCSNLRDFHPSIGILKKLVHLNLAYCEKLSSLPSKFEMDSLKTFNLSCCVILKKIPKFMGSMIFLDAQNLTTCLRTLGMSKIFLDAQKIDNLPKNLGNVKGLKKLNLSGTAIKELPSSIERLTNLTLLTLLKCCKLVCLPNTKCGFKFRGALDLSRNTKFKKLPENLWIIEDPEILDLSRTAIEELPIEHLTTLTLLTLKDCKNLVCLPSTICSLKLLESLDLSGCSKFDNLPENLGNVEGLQSLTDLHLIHCDLSSIPNDIGCLSSLECLDPSRNNLVSLPESMSQLSNLRTLYLEGCKRLQSLENVPSTIDSIIAGDCISLERLPELQFYLSRTDFIRLRLEHFPGT
ncbi:hypothetical protein SO802_032204 [Lithocarpus litseifolius]|uniref:Disease resistance R13L4/SHOC-2-like LRR domain-containing protein n=1 Tax=Lithocarpus litseifolius TaxID=425828 RepID=A0AAW2BP14_9ROSI